MISRLFCKNIIAGHAKQDKTIKNKQNEDKTSENISARYFFLDVTNMYHVVWNSTFDDNSFILFLLISIPWFFLVVEKRTSPVWIACITHTSMVCNGVMSYDTLRKKELTPLPSLSPFSPLLFPYLHFQSVSILSTDILLSISLFLGALPAIAWRYDRWIPMAPVSPCSKNREEMKRGHTDRETQSQRIRER